MYENQNVENNHEEQEKPREPEKPIKPEEPGEPEKTIKPEEPEEPENPIKPEEPEEPENPIKPEEPGEPEKPIKPEEPGEPEKPIKPEEPEEPENPMKLEEPENNMKTEEQEKPIKPEEPEEPRKPEEVTNPFHTQETLSSDAQKTRLCERMRLSCSFSQYSDFVLKTREKEGQKSEKLLYCHQVVLASGSPYFQELLERERSRPKEIDVTEYQIAALEEALYFIYTGSCLAKVDYIVDLTKLAYKWKLDYLVEECITYILKETTLKTACQLYLIFDKEKRGKATDFLATYIRKNFELLYDLGELEKMPNGTIQKIMNEKKEEKTPEMSRIYLEIYAKRFH